MQRLRLFTSGGRPETTLTSNQRSITCLLPVWCERGQRGREGTGVPGPPKVQCWLAFAGLPGLLGDGPPMMPVLSKSLPVLRPPSVALLVGIA
jgi:hypothetical protein